MQTGTIAIIGMVTGVLGIVISIITFIKQQYDTKSSYIMAYMNYAKEIQYVSARKCVYGLGKYSPDALSDDERESIAIVANHLDSAGLLVKKGYLPKWLFRNSSNGILVVRIYKILKPYIVYRRDYSNPYYAKYFEELYNFCEKCNSQKVLVRPKIPA